ncbi:MAG: hypothetical protein ACREEM_55500 [Blastocatellia bacterium]
MHQMIAERGEQVYGEGASEIAGTHEPNVLRQTVTGRIPPHQLTATKLERLMDRYAGREWLPTPLKRLDEPDSEKADVLRGLRTYVTSSPENARTFAELYAKLPADSQALPPKIVKKLSQGK